MLKVKAGVWLFRPMVSPSKSYEASSAVWDYTVLLPPDTGERAPL